MTELAELRQELADLGRPPRADEVARAMRRRGAVVTDDSLATTLDALRRNSLGAGPLEGLLHTPGVTDVLVNGADQVWVDGAQGLQRTTIRFADDDASPWVDARLADGTRFHAVLGTLGDPGTCLSLRVPARRTLDLDDWVRCGAIPVGGAQVLRALVESKVAFIVSGGTGSGKTTMLASLLSGPCQ